MKLCSRCQIEKELEEFGKDSQKRDGLRNYCRTCTSLINKEQKQKHGYSVTIEKSSIACKKYYNKQKELLGDDSFKEWKRLKRKSHIEKAKETRKLYTKNNRYKISIITKNWVSKNRDRVNTYVCQRRAIKLQSMPNWANKKYINLFFEIAKLEEERTDKKCHVDHIVPLKSLVVCGLHTEYNLQILLAKDNISKGNRFWPGMPDDIQEVLTFYGLK